MNGFHTITDKVCRSDTFCNAHIERWYLSSNTQKIPIREGNIRGTLFTPIGCYKVPGIIDMFGTFGGLREYRAAMLASYGYSVLSLAYFAYDDLPNRLDFNYEYFDEAVEMLLNHPSVESSQGLGIIGIAKGAEIALHLASFNPHIKACISINAFSFYINGKGMYRGRDLKVFTPSLDDFAVADKEAVFIKETLDTKKDLTHAIPVHRSKASFFLLQGTDDLAVDPCQSLLIAERILKSGNHNCTLKLYPGAGHILDPPFMPLCKTVYHQAYGLALGYGGERRLHAKAQQQAWKDILEYLGDTFGNTDYKRLGRLPISKI